MTHWNSTRIAEWAERTFGPATALSTAIRAQKELTELIEKLQLLAEGKVPHTSKTGMEIMTEVADVRIVLARVQRFFPGAMTAEDAEQHKMDINAARKWKLDGHGHGQHIEETHETFVGGVRMTVAKPCPECGSEKGHTIDCSEGIPF